MSRARPRVEYFDVTVRVKVVLDQGGPASAARGIARELIENGRDITVGATLQVGSYSAKTIGRPRLERVDFESEQDLKRQLRRPVGASL